VRELTASLAPGSGAFEQKKGNTFIKPVFILEKLRPFINKSFCHSVQASASIGLGKGGDLP